MLCFRLHFAKNSTTINTAGATVRQLVYLVFERVISEDEQISKAENVPQRGPVNFEDLKAPSGNPPKGIIKYFVLFGKKIHNFCRTTSLCW